MSEILTKQGSRARESMGKVASAHNGLRSRLGDDYDLAGLPEDELVVLQRIARGLCERLAEVLVLRREG